MSAPNQGRQSPPPEQSTGAQQQDTPSHGQGVNEETKNKEESEGQLDVCLYLKYSSWHLPDHKADCTFKGLASNPAGPLDDHLKDTMKKTMDPSQSSK